MIPFDLVRESGVNIDKGVLLPHGGIVGVAWDPIVDIDSLKVGEAEVRNLGVTIVRKGFLVEDRKGLLGANFLDDFCVDIRYDQNEVIFERVEGPYAGYPAEWWQKRFRYYHRLKANYEMLRKRSYVRMTPQWDQVCKRARQAAAFGKVYRWRNGNIHGVGIPQACFIEEGLYTIKMKLSDLEQRASDAELPRKFKR